MDAEKLSGVCIVVNLMPFSLFAGQIVLEAHCEVTKRSKVSWVLRLCSNWVIFSRILTPCSLAQLSVSSRSIMRSCNIGILNIGVLLMSSRSPLVRIHEAGKKGLSSRVCLHQSESKSRSACHSSAGCIWFHLHLLGFGLDLELLVVGDATPVQGLPWKNTVRSKLVPWWWSQHQGPVKYKATMFQVTTAWMGCSREMLPCGDVSLRYLTKNLWRQVFDWAYYIKVILVRSCFNEFFLRLPAYGSSGSALLRVSSDRSSANGSTIRRNSPWKLGLQAAWPARCASLAIFLQSLYWITTQTPCRSRPY